MTTTTHLALPLIAAGQAQKHVTHNEALLAVDALLHCAVKDKDLAAPPASPAEGDRYIVAAAPTGAWAGKAEQVAAWQDGLWRVYAPKAGWIAFVVDELQLYHFNGAAWAPGVLAITNLQNLTLLGIGTAADATNPFSTKLNNVLHAAKTVAEGGSGNIQVKLSKESAAKTASYLFQTNFSGRAELGLTGDDNFHLRTSADGASWVDALVLAAATGAATFAAGATFGGAVSGITTLNATGTATFGNGTSGLVQINGGAGSFPAFQFQYGGVTKASARIYDSAGGFVLSGNGSSTHLHVTTTGVVQPGADNTASLGSASLRWSVVYAGTSTINTSSADEKTNFRAPDEAVLLAALDTEQSFYQWGEAVMRKGEDKARWHFGPTAQGFAAACRTRGVDPSTLALYCEDPQLAPVKKTRPVERERFVGRKRRRRIVETVMEEYEVLEPTGGMQYGLRLDQFDRLLSEARWRVLTGRLSHTRPNA